MPILSLENKTIHASNHLFLYQQMTAMHIEKIQFGKTNLQVTPMGLGLAALGRPGYINLGHGKDLNQNYEVAAMEDHSHQMLELAYNRGIRYFDAARSYGKAEQFLSSWMGDKKDITIGSKWGYTYTADWKVDAKYHEIKEHSVDVLNRQWEETLETFKRAPDIYHIHSASIESGVLDNNQVLDRLWELKDKGLIVGLSLSGPRQSDTLEKSIEIKSGDAQLFQSVQVTWNVLERSTSQMIEKASVAGYGIIAKEALANGRLTERNSDGSFIEKLNTLTEIAAKHQVGVDAIAIAYVLQQPWASVVLSGAARQSHLISNLKAFEIKLTPNDLHKLDELKETPENYWQTRSNLRWN
jgi:aryl-alcohol dehydrogenase-like predicted oxidoreductase